MGSGDQLARGRILVVDDDIHTATTLHRMLARCGHQVTSVHSGLAAVEAAISERPDVLVLDVDLPDIDGIEVCRRLRRDPATQGVGVVMVTGSQLSVPEEGLRCGADYYMRKPVSKDDLLDHIQLLIGGRGVAD